MREIRRRSATGGFTLVETLASLVIFTLVTLGLVPVILTSIRGTNLSRSATIGRNVASEAMERLRGLPFHVAYSTQAQRVDVLDFYFPRASGTGFNATTNTYTVTCSGSGSGACPAALPDGYTLTFRSAFVTRSGSPEVYTAVVPSGSYAWNSAGNDTPQAELLRIEVTGRWSLLGRQRSVNLTTLISDRAFGGLQARASAVTDYAVQVLTGFDQGSNEEDVIAQAGISQSEATARRLSDASHTTRAASLRLIDARDAVGTDLPGSPVQGAVADVAAPPQVSPTSSSAVAGTLNSVNFGAVAGIRGTNTSNAQASVGSGTPAASGAWSFLAGTSTELDFWTDNPGADRAATSLYRFSTEKLLSVRTKGSNTLTGTTSASVNAAGSGSQSSATASFNDLRLLPTTFVPTANCTVQSPCQNSAFGGAVVAIDGFSATTNCLASLTAPSVTAGYQATVRYWSDAVEDDLRAGQYASVTLNVASGTSGADALSQLSATWRANPPLTPLVFDSTQDQNDVYLFPVTHTSARDGHNHVHSGYLSEWSSDGTLEATILQGGRLVAADIDNAISVATQPTTANAPDTAFSVSVGHLGCDAEERR